MKSILPAFFIRRQIGEGDFHGVADGFPECTSTMSRLAYGLREHCNRSSQGANLHVCHFSPLIPFHPANRFNCEEGECVEHVIVADQVLLSV